MKTAAVKLFEFIINVMVGVLLVLAMVILQEYWEPMFYAITLTMALLLVYLKLKPVYRKLKGNKK